MLLSPRKNGLTSLFKEVRVFKEKGVFSEKGGGIQWKSGLVRISTGKAIQRPGPSDSVNRRTLKNEKLLSSSHSRKSALRKISPGSTEPPTKVWEEVREFTSHGRKVDPRPSLKVPSPQSCVRQAQEIPVAATRICHLMWLSLQLRAVNLARKYSLYNIITKIWNLTTSFVMQFVCNPKKINSNTKCVM